MKKTTMKQNKKSAIAVQYERLAFKDKSFIWMMIISGFIAVLMLVYIHVIFGLFIGLVMALMVVAWLKKIKPIQSRLQVLEHLTIPSQHLNQLKIIFPHITTTQQQWIIEGFKDYLAMHIWSEKHLAMPSYAVDQLWHSLLTDPINYHAICQKTLGRELKHIEYDQHQQVSLQQQQESYWQTWYASCLINRLNPRKTTVLPRLFAIDFVLGIKNNAEAELASCLGGFHGYLADNNRYSCGGSSSCSSCGGD